jgi:hypothetical protein
MHGPLNARHLQRTGCMRLGPFLKQPNVRPVSSITKISLASATYHWRRDCSRKRPAMWRHLASSNRATESTVDDCRWPARVLRTLVRSKTKGPQHQGYVWVLTNRMRVMRRTGGSRVVMSGLSGLDHHVTSPFSVTAYTTVVQLRLMLWRDTRCHGTGGIDTDVYLA